jgi:hypothetical protein
MCSVFPDDFPELGDRIGVILPDGKRINALVHERVWPVSGREFAVILWDVNLAPYEERLIYRDRKWFAKHLSDGSEQEIKLWIM